MSNEKELLANEEIEAKEVRLIHAPINFNQVMTIADALLIASNEGLDLVQMSDQDVPVVKLLDLNKFKFEQKQKEKQQKKSQRESTVQVKEIQLSLDIQLNDMQTKLKKANKFLSQGKHLKITLRLRGRSRSNVTMQGLALDKVNEFLDMLDSHDVTQAPKTGTDTIMYMVKPSA